MTPSFAEQFARLGKAIAHPHRVLLLDLLAQGDRCVDALARAAGISIANASQHLQILRIAHLVTRRRQGAHAIYHIAGPSVLTFLACLQRTAEQQLAEIRTLAHETLGEDDLDPIDHAELQRRIAAGEVVLLDVRPAEEFAAAHLPGALSVPIAELHARLKELPATAEVIAYCRGPYCAMAVDAVRCLREAGYRARRLPEGPVEWHRSGSALTRSDPNDAGRGPADHARIARAAPSLLVALAAPLLFLAACTGSSDKSQQTGATPGGTAPPPVAAETDAVQPSPPAVRRHHLDFEAYWSYDNLVVEEVAVVDADGAALSEQPSCLSELEMILRQGDRVFPAELDDG